MATRFDDELAAVLADLQASGSGVETWVRPILSLQTETPEEETKKRGLLSTLGNILHAPKRTVDVALNFYANEGLRRRVLAGEEPVPAGELAKHAYIGAPETGQSPTEQHLRAVARGATERVIDMSTDPVNLAMMAVGVPGGPAVKTAVNLAFGGMMVKGAVESADATYQSFRREGWSPTTSEEAAKTVFDTGFAGLAIRDAARLLRPRQPTRGTSRGAIEPEVLPPEQGVATVPRRPRPPIIEARPIPGGRPPRAPVDRQLPEAPEGGGSREAPPAPQPPPRTAPRPAHELANINLPGDPARLSDEALLSTLRGFDGAISDAIASRDITRAENLRRHRSSLSDLYRARRYAPEVRVGRAGDLMQLRDTLQQERAAGPGVERDLQIAESLQVIDAELGRIAPAVAPTGPPAPTFTERPAAVPPAGPPETAVSQPQAAPSRMPQVETQIAPETVSPLEVAAAVPARLQGQRAGVQELLERAQATTAGIEAPARPEIAKVLEGGEVVAPEVEVIPPRGGPFPEPGAPVIDVNLTSPRTQMPVAMPQPASPAPAPSAPPQAAALAPAPADVPAAAPSQAPEPVAPGVRLTPAASTKKAAASPLTVLDIEGKPYWSNNHMVVRGRAKGGTKQPLDVKVFREATKADVPAEAVGYDEGAPSSTAMGGEPTPGRRPAVWLEGHIRQGKKIQVPIDPDYFRTIEDAGPGRWAVDRKGTRATRFSDDGSVLGSVAKLNLKDQAPADLRPMGKAPEVGGDAAAAQAHADAIEGARDKAGRVQWKKVPEPPLDEGGNRILPGQEEWSPARRKLVHAEAESSARDVKALEDAEPTRRFVPILNEEGKIDYDTARAGGSMAGAVAGVKSKKPGTALEDVDYGPTEVIEKLRRDKGNPEELEIHSAVDRWNQDFAYRHAAEVKDYPDWREAYPDDIAAGLKDTPRAADRRVSEAPIPVDRRVSARRRIVAEQVGLPEDHPAVARAAEAEIAARTDKLTGLGNKAHWDEVLETVSEKDRVAVLDLKKFKGINDKLGHAAGDAVLQHVASVLDKHFDGDSARFGGDEFGGVLRDVSVEEATTRMEAVREELAASVVDVLDPAGKQVAIQGIEAHIGVGRNAREADLAANAVAEESRRGGRGEVPRLAPSEPGAGGAGVEGLPDRGREVSRPAEGEVARRPVYEKTPLGDQALIPGTLDAAASMPVPKPKETFTDSPLFQQEETAAARAEEAAFRAAQQQLPVEAVQVVLEDQGLKPGDLGGWDPVADKAGSLAVPDNAPARLKAWSEVRNAARMMSASIDLVGEGGSTAAIGRAQAAAKAYVDKFGPLHEAPFASDPDYPLTLTLEDYAPASRRGPHKIAPIRPATAKPSDLSAATPEALGEKLADVFEAEAAGGEGGAGEPPAGPPKPGAPEIEPEPSKWRKTVNAAKARTRARGKGGKANIGVDPQAAADIAIEGADYAFRGARSFASWAEVMMRTVGKFVSGLRDMLAGIWRAVRGLFTPRPAAPEGARMPPGAETGRPGPKPKGEWEVPPEDVRGAAEAGKKAGTEPVSGKPPQDPTNFERSNSEPEIKAWEKRVTDELRDQYKDAKSYRSWKEAHAAAVKAGLSEADVARLLKEHGVLTDWQIDAGRILRETAAGAAVEKRNRLQELQGRLRETTDVEARRKLEEEILEAERDYQAATYKYAAVQATTVAAGAEAGRALAIHRRLVEGLTPEERWMRKLMRGASLSEKQLSELGDAVSRRDHAAMNRLGREIVKPRALDYAREWYLNALLSSVSTPAVNTMSNFAWEALFRLPERGVAAVLERGPRQWMERLFGREAVGPERFSQEMEAALRAELQLGFGIPRAAKLAWEAIWNESPLTAGNVKGEYHPAAWPGIFGKVIRTPSRIMDALDIGARHSAMEGEAQARLIRMAMAEARKAGGWSPERVKARVREIETDYRRFADLEMRRRSGEVLTKDENRFMLENRQYDAMHRGIEHAGAEGTFRDQVDKLTRGLLQMRQAHPWMNFFIPFVATPSRILAQALKRSPFGAYDVFRRAKSGELQGGALADEMAKVVWGNLIGAGLYLLARNGFLTGSGPSDPDEARVWKQTGKLPYSVKLGDTWVSLARLEPLSTTLGWAADLAEAQDQKTAGKLYDKLTQTLMANIVNKSYWQSVTGLAEGIADPERQGPMMLRRLAGGFVPNILAAAARSIDPTVRETPDISSTLLARIPILSETLPAKHGGTGEEVIRGEDPLSRFASPFRYSKELGPEGNLERIMLSTGYIPQAPPKQLTVPGTFGKKVELTSAERELYAAYAARATAYARTLASDDDFMDLHPLVQEELLKRIYRFAHDRGHQALLAAVANRMSR